MICRYIEYFIFSFQQFDIIPDGKVTYVKKGETYFLPYGLTDLQEPTIPVKVGDRVSIRNKPFRISLYQFYSISGILQCWSRSSHQSIFCSQCSFDGQTSSIDHHQISNVFVVLYQL